MASQDTVPLTTREAASGLLGSVSMTCWIFLLVPQLIENYRNGNAEAISLLFIFVWFIGDITNLLGGTLAGLVPVIIAIAVYFCLADGVLIAQCLYYKVRNSRRGSIHRRRRSSTETPDPTTPLLGRRFSDSFPAGQGRRRSSGSMRRFQGAGRRESQVEDPLAKIVEENEYGRKAWVKNLISVIGIFVVGIAGWTIAWQTGIWAPAPLENNKPADIATSGAVLGYASAVCYLGARLPQIYKNYRDQSCEGLSLLFFILSLLGNVTYGAGILCHSTEHDYVVTNLPWLIGSLGTMAEDVTIFIQFRLYAVQDAQSTLQS
ncbi:vacuolar membrane PQ loop repeat protein [Penicillium brasilianum]|uniref:Vacuolar membrane PQ loop repeat protein n=1 Tax=Penicillium brasilianum TaxID=104259 RepID=A0A1S9R9K4_PENBI|nr:vacuolar membrane PQ loop repeat protein [Penicillium brasilianum]